MRIVELFEELKGIFDLVDPKIERFETLIVDVEPGLLLGAVSPVGRDGEARLDRRTGRRRAGRRLSVLLFTPHPQEPCRKDDGRQNDAQIDRDRCQMISQLHKIKIPNLYSKILRR